MKDLLKKHFGYDTFRPLQEEIITHLLRGNDALVLMPTGGGKSLCYQLPALVFDGVTVVISPLIALMKDQVDALTAIGIPAAYINSTLSPTQMVAAQRMVQQGRIKILYVAPERLAFPIFRGFLQTCRIALFAIDEAHCISEWGHDFRPDYRELKILREEFPGAPIVALTATATERVRYDIVEQLGFADYRMFIASFDRQNLLYSVVSKKNSDETLLHLLRRYQGESAIIYCFSRGGTESLAEKLRNQGFAALAYHAGFDADLRHKTQELFISGTVPIITATIAFGMGIDKPDIRLVVHYDLPKSLESYYQETGRAGRDGLPSECILFFSASDRFRQAHFIEEISDPDERRRAYDKLDLMVQYGYLSSCRRRYLLEYFGEDYNACNCGACDNCLKATLRRPVSPSPVKLTTPKVPSPNSAKTGLSQTPTTPLADEFDATLIAQKILSAVIRTGEKHGARHIARVLTGKTHRNVLRYGHDQLSVFNIVDDFSLKEIGILMAHLAERGLLATTHARLPKFRVTPEGREFLRQRATIRLPIPKRRREPEPNPSQEGGKFPSPNIAQPSKPVTATRKTTYEKTKELFLERLPLEEIAARRGLAEETVQGHLHYLMENDPSLDIEYLRPPAERLARIKAAFEDSCGWSLKPARDLLGEEFSYAELDIARFFLRRRSSSSDS